MKKLLGILACVCLMLVLCTTAVAATHDHTGFTALTTENWNQNHSDGSYYLAGEGNTINAPNYLTIDSYDDITLCLNGKTLNLGEKSISVKIGGKLTICDCQSTVGTITSNDAHTIGVNQGGTLTLERGTITGGTISTMENSGTVHIKGGSVVSTTAPGIRCKGGSLYLSGTPTITGGTGKASLYQFSTDGKIYPHAEGDATTKYNGETLTIETSGKRADAVIVTGVDDNTATKFKLINNDNNANFEMVRGTGNNANNLVLKEKPAASAGHAHDSTTYTALTLAASGETTLSTDGYYYLESNATATGKITIPNDVTVTLCLNGKALDMGNNEERFVRVLHGGALTICDCQSSTGKITSTAAGNHHSTIKNAGSLTLQSGKVESIAVTGKNYTRAVENIGAFVMSGGNLSGSTGIYSVNSVDAGRDPATVSVSGGTITGTGNSAVYMSAGKVEINGTPTFDGVDTKGDIALNEEAQIELKNQQYAAIISIRVLETTRQSPVVLGSTKTEQFSLTSEDYVLKAESGNLVLAEKTTAPTTYTVSFNANTGTGTMADVTGVSGTYTLPANGFTAPAGKMFDKWDVNGTKYAAGATITVTADTTVTATWKDIPVTAPSDVTAGSVPETGTTVVIGEGVDGFAVGDVQTVEVNGNTVAATNYDVTIGSLKITFKQSYLNTLTAGDYPVKITLTGTHAGTYTTTLKVQAAGGTGGTYVPPTSVIQSPKTFDAGVALYTGMALASAAGAVYVTRKKN